MHLSLILLSPATLIYLLLVALVVWVIFYVLPLPPIVRTIFAVVIGVALIMWLLGGCTGLPQRSYSVYGRNAEGVELGAKVTLGDTRGLAK